MDWTPFAIGLTIGVVATAIVAWVLARSRPNSAAAALREQRARLETQLQAEKAAVQQARIQLEQRDQALSELREDRARLQTQLEAEKAAFQKAQVMLDEAEGRMREAFQALSAEALRQNNEAFLSMAKTSLQWSKGVSVRSEGRAFAKRSENIQ